MICIQLAHVFSHISLQRGAQMSDGAIGSQQSDVRRCILVAARCGRDDSIADLIEGTTACNPYAKNDGLYDVWLTNYSREREDLRALQLWSQSLASCLNDRRRGVRS